MEVELDKGLIVLVTIPEKKAKSFSRKLLGKKLCACVNLIRGLESFFWWEGKISTAKEALLVIKTKGSNFLKLEKFIKSIHPYTVPEIIACKIDRINKAYLSWLIKESSD